LGFKLNDTTFMNYDLSITIEKQIIA